MDFQGVKSGNQVKVCAVTKGGPMASWSWPAAGFSSWVIRGSKPLGRLNRFRRLCGRLLAPRLPLH